jgi:hypothetical protein
MLGSVGGAAIPNEFMCICQRLQVFKACTISPKSQCLAQTPVTKAPSKSTKFCNVLQMSYRSVNSQLHRLMVTRKMIRKPCQIAQISEKNCP